MKLNLPKLIGHRGAAAYAPENTLEAIHTAADMGVEWVELDVKLTKDQIPVLFHDETLERTTQASGNVADFTLADLQQLEVGSWFSGSFAGIQIPTLEEALDVILARDLGFNMEIKPCPGREVETAEAALDLLSHVWEDRSRLLISSKSQVSLETSFDMVENWYRGLVLTDEWPENLAEVIQYLELSALSINGQLFTDQQQDIAADLNIPLLAYTINDPALARDLMVRGIKTFFTDEPDTIDACLFTVH